jgi:lysophospholipase L1-like esterase
MDRTLEIVSIGDSLTLGLNSSYQKGSQSYPDYLEQSISDLLNLTSKNTKALQVLNKGINGDLTQNMLLRFKRDVIDLEPNYVIVLGGTNDLGWGIPVTKIFNNLKIMFHLAITNHIQPLGCTVPSLLGRDEGIPPRLKLNEMIKKYCQTQGILCADLFQSTANGFTKRLRKDYSDDGLHLTSKGYQKMAETVFSTLILPLITFLY